MSEARLNDLDLPNAAAGRPIERRALLATIPLAAAAAAWPAGLASAGAQDGAGDASAAGAPPAASVPPPFALDSPPVLQNPAPDGMTVAWAINGRATGWVEYGPSPDDLPHRALTSRRGLVAVERRFLSARIRGLAPGQKVYYRVVAAPVDYRGSTDIRRGAPVASPVHHFTTLDPRAGAAEFVVINDTHQNVQTLTRLTGALADSSADLALWNGDVFNDLFSDDQMVEQALRPVGAAYAAARPMLFTIGNHDVRGPEARGLEHAIIPTVEEPLGRCFAVRHGPLAIIGLDTGEDKPDVRPVFAGLADFELYRRDQRDWLAGVLRRPEIAAAKFLVVCCHIPLNGLPGQNGGDTTEDFARYSKQSRELWGPLITGAGAQVVISGHTHRHRYDDPAPDRPWGQLVGGGPEPEHATIIRGRADSDQLRITAHKLDGAVLGEWRFGPRAV